MFIVKVPGINGLGKTEGCEKAGNAILKSLREIYSNENGKEINVDKLDLEEIHLDNKNLELTNQLIYKNSLDCFEDKPRTIFLGGDHSISYSIIKAFFESVQKNEKEPCLIVFDAHADCMKPVDKNFPTHEEWLRCLIEFGFPIENILLVGVRNVWKDELKFLEDKKIQQININSIVEDIDNIADTIMEFASGKELYVSLDIDIVDPSFAPATGYLEPGGLTSRQFIYLIQRISKMKNLRGVDVVEINPDKDINNLTVKLGAKVLGELI